VENLSGTLAYLFNVYDGSKAFSKSFGKQENATRKPDPREDLSWVDVAKKVDPFLHAKWTTLEIGETFPVQNLVPKHLREMFG